MAFDYDIDAPLDDSYIADFPPNERAAREAARDSVNYDHFAETSGHHRQVTLDARGGDPSSITTEGFVYTKVTGDITELFYMDDSGLVIQLTDDGSASPDKMPLAGGEFSGDVTWTDADLLVEGTSLIKLLNAKYLQGRDKDDAAWRDLIGVNSSDEVEIGDASLSADGRIYVTDVDGLVVSYAAADKIVWNKGHFANAPVATQTYESTPAEITFPGTGEVTHSIPGGTPGLWWAELICTSNDVSYIVGDSIPLMGGIAAFRATPRGITVNATGTKFQWRCPGSAMQVIDGAGASNIDEEKWKIAFRAWY